MREYFEKLTQEFEPLDPEMAKHYQSFADSLTSSDLMHPTFYEESLLLGLLFKKFLPTYNPTLLYRIAEAEGIHIDRSKSLRENSPLLAWALKWLQAPAYYNPAATASHAELPAASAPAVPGSGTVPNQPRAMSASGQGLAMLVALMGLEFRGAFEEGKVLWDILFHSGTKSLGHYIYQGGAVQLMLEKLLTTRYPSEADRPEIVVKPMDNPRRGQGMTFERSINSETGKSMIIVRYNPHLKLQTLRWGAVHEMFHELEPASNEVMAEMQEEIVVTRETRKFMAEYNDNLLKVVDASGQAVRSAVAEGVAPTPQQLDDNIFQDLWKNIHKTKQDDMNLMAARRSFLDAA